MPEDIDMSLSREQRLTVVQAAQTAMAMSVLIEPVREDPIGKIELDRTNVGLCAENARIAVAALVVFRTRHVIAEVDDRAAEVRHVRGRASAVRSERSQRR